MKRGKKDSFIAYLIISFLIIDLIRTLITGPLTIITIEVLAVIA